MTEEELPRAMREHAAMQNAAPKPSLEARLDWLEADSAAQRAAITRLRAELATALLAANMLLALAVLT